MMVTKWITQKYVLGLIIAALVLIGCSKDEFEPYDQPYVHIMVNELSTVQVASNRSDAVNYNIYFSTGREQDIEVTYEILPGDGLQEGRDYSVITTQNPIPFPAGIYERAIQIRWMNRRVDPEKDNRLTIKLIEANREDVIVGLPGPDGNQSELVIEKVNP